MGTGSYVLAGAEKAFEETFGSTCHGAGRVMSRGRAMKESKNRSIEKEMADRGIVVMAAGKKTIREEMPDAYKRYRRRCKHCPSGWSIQKSREAQSRRLYQGMILLINDLFTRSLRYAQK